MSRGCFLWLDMSINIRAAMATHGLKIRPYEASLVEGRRSSWAHQAREVPLFPNSDKPEAILGAHWGSCVARSSKRQE